jgi:hypothetical protein
MKILVAFNFSLFLCICRGKEKETGTVRNDETHIQPEFPKFAKFNCLLKWSLLLEYCHNAE